MREILFRGKRIDNGEWVEGFYHFSKWYIPASMKLVDTTYSIRPIGAGDAYQVAPATVGQYAGMPDKNGKWIFEGDIVRDMDGTTYPVVWGHTGFYLRYDPPHAHGMEYELLPLCNYWHAHGPIIEIIGNIHDDPELMEVDHED